MKYLFSLFLLALCGCQSLNQVSSLATPANVQIAISVLGAAVQSKITASDKEVIHQVATALKALTTATVDSTTVAPIENLIPQLSNQYAKSLVSAGLIDLNLALAKFGSHNATVLAYATAVGNGLSSVF